MCRRVDDSLINSGYTRSTLEPCLYVKSSNDLRTLIALYVEDISFFSNDQHESKLLKPVLPSHFKLKDLGQVGQCLSANVNIDNVNNVTLKKGKSCYVDQLFHRFNMTECKVVGAPM